MLCCASLLVSFAGDGILCQHLQCTRDLVPLQVRLQIRLQIYNATRAGLVCNHYSGAAQHLPGTLHGTGFTARSRDAVQRRRQPQQAPQVTSHLCTTDQRPT